MGSISFYNFTRHGSCVHHSAHNFAMSVRWLEAASVLRAPETNHWFCCGSRNKARIDNSPRLQKAQANKARGVRSCKLRCRHCPRKKPPGIIRSAPFLHSRRQLDTVCEASLVRSGAAGRISKIQLTGLAYNYFLFRFSWFFLSQDSCLQNCRGESSWFRLKINLILFVFHTSGATGARTASLTGVCFPLLIPNK